jgi:hypothetical protein
MNLKENARFTTLVLVILLAVLSVLLSGCGNTPTADQIIDQKKTKDVSNFDSMSNALGCVFAPQHCKK